MLSCSPNQQADSRSTSLAYFQGAVDLAVLHEISPADALLGIHLTGFDVLGQIQLDIAQRYPFSPAAGGVFLNAFEVYPCVLQQVVLVHCQAYRDLLLIVVYDLVILDRALLRSTAMLRSRRMREVPFY